MLSERKSFARKAFATCSRVIKVFNLLQITGYFLYVHFDIKSVTAGNVKVKYP
jgi:hypothetical protein